MTRNTTIRVTGNENGLVRVWAPDVTSASKQAARKLAAGEAHSLVGAAQDLGTAKGGHILGFAPIARRTVAPTAPAKARKAGKRDAEIAELRARLAALLGDSPKAPKALPAFMRKADVTCETCEDLGYVRGVGKHAGDAYKTANGVKAAREGGRAVKCPSHKRASKTA